MVRPRSLFSPPLLFAALLSACTIEGSRQLGDDCLTTRECASGLRCELTTTGVSRCVAATRFDVAPLDVSASADVAPDMAPADAAVPPDAAPDVAMMLDAPREMAVAPDVPADEPRVEAATPDAAPDSAPDSAPDAAPDAAPDIVDVATDAAADDGTTDAPRDTTTDAAAD